MEVDVLVDLNGHTQGDNFDILSHRPAPVQASWLGYAGTTAAPFIDYVDRRPDRRARCGRLYRKARLSAQLFLSPRYQPGAWQASQPRRSGLAARRFCLLFLQQQLETHRAGLRPLDAAAGGSAGQRAVAQTGRRQSQGQSAGSRQDAWHRTAPADLRGRPRRSMSISPGTDWPICFWTPCPTMPMPPPATRCGRACRS